MGGDALGAGVEASFRDGSPDRAWGMSRDGFLGHGRLGSREAVGRAFTLKASR